LIKNNKIILFIILFILSIGISSTSFARELEDFSFPETLEQAVLSSDGGETLYNNICNLPEFNDNYYYFYRFGNYNDITFIEKSRFLDLKSYITIEPASYGDTRYCRITLQSGSFKSEDIFSTYNITGSTLTRPEYYYNYNNFLFFGGSNNVIGGFTNVPVYTDNTYSTFFFPEVIAPEEIPPEMEQVETILATAVGDKQEIMKGVLQEIINLLPLIIVVVVSFLGLRKALKLLSTLLHRA